MKLIIATLAAALLAGCKNESDKNDLVLRVPSNGGIFTAIKIEDVTDYSKYNHKIYEQFSDLLEDLTAENYLGRMRYKDLPVTWWAGTAEFTLQNWKVTTDKRTIWINVYERKSAPGRVINVYDSENTEPSDFYGVSR